MTEHQTEPSRAVLASPAPSAAPSELAQAFDHADDRSQRLDYQLNNLEEVITRITIALEPVMTNGQPYPAPPSDPATVGRAPDDSRSQVTRRVHGLAERYDRAAEYVGDQTARLNRLLEALEV